VRINLSNAKRDHIFSLKKAEKENKKIWKCSPNVSISNVVKMKILAQIRE